MEYERFVTQVQPHMRAMVRVAAALVGTMDAEDAAQEALVRAWQSWQGDPLRPVTRAWLLRITINGCLNWQKGHFGTRQRRTASLEDPGLSPFATADAPGDDLHTATLDLRQAVERLPADLRVIVLLRYYGGLDATEISEARGIPAATVRTQLRRALRLMRDRLYGPGTYEEQVERKASDV